MTHLPPTERSLPIALLRARERVMAPIREMLAASGVTEQQWRILRVLVEGGPQEATVLAARACLQAPSLTRIVQSMEKRGLVVRTRADDDRRKQIVAATDEGRAIIEVHLEEASRIAARYRERLGEDRYEDLLATLMMLEDL
ncbi:MAG: homoprotocatechuate degradation operon regulator HpaR [Pseudomonadota bacterium]